MSLKSAPLERSINNVLIDLPSSLQLANESIRKSLSLLREIYQLDEPLPQFVGARHRLFAETSLYGQFLHCHLVEIVNTIKESMEVMCQVSDPSKISEVLQVEAADCRTSLALGKSLESKYNWILESMQQWKGDIEDDLSQMVEGTKTTLPASGGGPVFGDVKSEAPRTLHCSRLTRVSPSQSAPAKFAGTGNNQTYVNTVKNWTVGTVQYWTGFDVIEFFRKEPEQHDGTDNVELWRIAGRSIDGFLQSLWIMCDVLRSATIFMEHLVLQAKGSSDQGRIDWADFLKKRVEFVEACKAFVMMKTHQERVLYSLRDRVDEGFKLQWLKGLKESDISKKVIIL